MNKSIKLPATRLKTLAVEGLILTIAISSLSAVTTMVNPLGAAFRSVDDGGTLPTIDAYKDGIGVIVIDNLSAGIQVDNTAINTLVYKYGDAAKTNNTTVVNQVMYGTGTAADKAIAGALTTNGSACNDNNTATTGETWLNGLCQGGVSTNGTPCNDNNVMTINDIYTNGVCVGILTVNGQSCNDNNSLTYNDIYTNGVCAGTPVEAATSTCSGGFGGNPYVGNITCGASGLYGITSGFLNLISVQNGWLDFDSNYLSNVNNLENVVEVKALYLNRNRLIDITGLRNLKIVNTELYLYYGSYAGNSNQDLDDLSPLNGLTFVGSYVYLENKNYNGKLNATSYLCQNPSKVYLGTSIANAITKSSFCY